MNAYWMNEMVYAGAECPVWAAIALGVVVVGFVVATAVVMYKSW